MIEGSFIRFDEIFFKDILVNFIFYRKGKSIFFKLQHLKDLLKLKIKKFKIGKLKRIKQLLSINVFLKTIACHNKKSKDLF